MHASFKFIAMLVLVTSTFTPAFSTPIGCVLNLFTISICAYLFVVPVTIAQISTVILETFIVRCL